jgi:hypothetical protein
MVEAVVQMKPPCHVTNSTVAVLSRKIVLAGYAAMVDVFVVATFHAIAKLVVAMTVVSVFRMLCTNAGRIDLRQVVTAVFRPGTRAMSPVLAVVGAVDVSTMVAVSHTSNHLLEAVTVDGTAVPRMSAKLANRGVPTGFAMATRATRFTVPVARPAAGVCGVAIAMHGFDHQGLER